ncbi:(deoxy)nucleoside triphosphate pyrophosphohydrolase [Microbacterium elymi]|uniref:8-oxo-dGTP diphosphatase n=1 Tax=Microbacterium elymi TaxID=2909587 RepID=A0ABY5NH42_9MICO|nr:(deoxy)nucleoside triphosphate pyrophosphohydrolase [Microbacterium elymi]UUT34504.1 (deoxy)nucleoside triphosphate pyrophosphohydrolase [Microbacterium elymi]
MTAAPLDVVAAVIVDGDRILACRRREGKADAGRWEFPGGKVEPGESPAEALVREVREELGIDIRIGEVLRTDVTDAAGRSIRLTCLAATLSGERPTDSTDHDRMEWVRPAELSALDWAEPDLPMVRELSGG